MQHTTLHVDDDDFLAEFELLFKLFGSDSGYPKFPHKSAPANDPAPKKNRYQQEHNRRQDRSQSLRIRNPLVKLRVENIAESGIQTRPERRSDNIEGHEAQGAGAGHAGERRRDCIQSNYQLREEEDLDAVAGKTLLNARNA